jgi:toxin ParE1/3/4
MIVQFAPKARDDLLDIALYIARDNPKRAISFSGELEARCVKLAIFPLSCRLRPELGPDIRVLVFKRYLAIYRAVDDAITVLRIVHGARDLEGLEI